MLGKREQKKISKAHSCLSELDGLVEQIHQLKNLGELPQLFIDVVGELTNSRYKIQQMKRVLRYYADDRNYGELEPSIIKDGGRKAKRVLG